MDFSRIESLCEGALFFVRYLNEAGEEEFQDYTTPTHPKVAKARQDLEKGLDWVANGLDRSGTPQMKRLAQQLKAVHALPSERVMPALQAIQGELFKANKDLKKPTLGKPTVHGAQAKAIDDAMAGLPALMKLAGTVTGSSMGDRNLWQKTTKGYFDREGEFHRKGSVVHPAGQEPKKSSPSPAAASAPPTPSAKPPMIRRKHESAWELATEAHVMTSDPDDILDAMKSNQTVVLSFPDDRAKDRFASRLAAVGLRKNADFFVEPESMELKSKSLLSKGGGMASQLAKELQKMDSGLAIDPRKTAPTNPGFWRS